MFSDAPGYLAAARAIKRALDPNGILAPGRYGLDVDG
jgi:FAD/FMN-containing dehydrogenase